MAHQANGADPVRQIIDATHGEIDIFACRQCSNFLWYVTAETLARPICATCGWTPEKSDGDSSNQH